MNAYYHTCEVQSDSVPEELLFLETLLQQWSSIRRLVEYPWSTTTNIISKIMQLYHVEWPGMSCMQSNDLVHACILIQSGHVDHIVLDCHTLHQGYVLLPF